MSFHRNGVVNEHNSCIHRGCCLNSVSIVTLLILTSAATPALADVGPKIGGFVVVTVTVDGQPLEEKDAVGTLLSLSPKFSDHPQHVPVLDDPSGGKWMQAGNLWGGKNENGTFRFHGFMPVGGIPDQVRVAVYIPSHDKVFVTDISPTRPHLVRMTADLHADGTGTLKLDWPSLWQELPFWQALGVTLFVELLVVFLFCRKKNVAIARPLRVVIWVNFLTLPVVWLFLIGSQLTLGTLTGVAAFVVVELLAVLFEGGMYRWRGKMEWKSAMTVSLIANGMSALLGLVT